jgi:hypothetical protein
VAKRDYIAEISAKRERLRRRGSRSAQFDARVDALIDIAEFLKKRRGQAIPAKAELAKYLPIGWVACIEGYFRLVYRDLIDHGPPYRENAATLKDIRIGLDHVVAMQAGKFTLGEFIAHLLSVNGLDDINQSMSTLLGVDYLDALKKVKTDLFEKNRSLEDLELSGRLAQSLDFLFTQRHVFAHELNTKVLVRLNDIFLHSRAALILISINETLMESHLGKAA